MQHDKNDEAPYTEKTIREHAAAEVDMADDLAAGLLAGAAVQLLGRLL